MPVKKSARAELNTLVKGIITEASPVNYPVGASRDERNFELNKDGTRDRRLGLDYEVGYQLRLFGVDKAAAFTSYRWKSPGGVPDKEFLVSQVGSNIYFYDNTKESISGNLITAYPVTTLDNNKKFSFATVGKYLVVGSGTSDLSAFTYEDGEVIKFTYRLKVRDQFGVDDFYTIAGVDEDLLTDERVDYRPATVTKKHGYNLRNQSWGVARSTGGSNRSDPITLYHNENSDFYPSNCDIVWTGMYNKTSADEVFSGWKCIRSSDGKIPAAKGYFIIDALNRGSSRVEEYIRNQANQGFSEFSIAANDLPADYTQGGCSEVVEFAGRVFYAGFSGEIVGGDDKSPDMSTYVLFSRLIRNKNDLGRCYQEGDPTGRGTTDVVDTDGGFIRISGAKTIKNLIALKDSVVVVAENGTWVISGGGEYGFTSTNYKVDKVCSFGTIAKYSAVSDGASAFYWSENGISVINKNQYGDFEWNSITKDTIKSLYETLSFSNNESVSGVFDIYENRIRWMFSTKGQFDPDNQIKELVFDITLKAFYMFDIGKVENGPEIVSAFNTPPYRVAEQDTQVMSGTEAVMSTTDFVVAETSVRTEGLRSVKYMTIIPTDDFVSVTFSAYRNDKFRDWEEFDGVGVDAKAYMLTGEIVADDTSVHKQVPYLVTHFKRTEEGLNESFEPNKQSSCWIRSRWDWADSVTSNKWSPAFQAYRYPRVYMPENLADPFDTGFELITTRNKIRGRGRAFSFYVETEPYKDCRMVGWSLSVNGNANV